MTNVHSFGAVGNGSSDDLAAINSTIADIVTIESGRIRKGDNLEFNSRMYRVSDTVHFGKHFGTQIVGKVLFLSSSTFVLMVVPISIPISFSLAHKLSVTAWSLA